MKRRLICIDITTGTYQDFLDRLGELALARVSAYVCFGNTNLLVKAYRDKRLARIVNQSAMTMPGGMPVARAMYTFYGQRQARITAIDLLPGLLRIAEQRNIPVFFYGSTQSTLDLAWEYCNLNYPELDIAGVYAPAAGLNKAEEQVIAERINRTEAGIVFVAMDCPNQEIWMSGMRGKINACMIGIGDALPLMLGLDERAPRWVQRLSMEWLFCLYQHPQRLTKQYLVTNSTYIWLLLSMLFRQGFGAKAPNQNQ